MSQIDVLLGIKTKFVSKELLHFAEKLYVFSLSYSLSNVIENGANLFWIFGKTSIDSLF